MTLIGLSLSIGGGYGAGGEIPPDTTAPTLTSPTGTATGAEMADLSVSTNEAGGTLYWYVSESATPPSAADLKAGTGAVDAGNQAVTATGSQTASADGLTAETSYYAHFLHRDAAGNDSAIVTSAAFVTEAQYGRTPDYNAGTDGDWFVAPDGSDSAAGTSVAAPFATLGKALSVASAGQTIRLRAGTYREQLDQSKRLTITGYGTELPVLSGAHQVTGWTACTSGDAGIVGAGWANVYKTSVSKSIFDPTVDYYHMLMLTEAGVMLDLVQRRADTSDLFEQTNAATAYSSTRGDDVSMAVDGSSVITSISHPSVLETYTDAQLARAYVMVHADPNVPTVLKVTGASGGVLSVDGNSTSPPAKPQKYATTPEYTYALLNALPSIAEGQWGFVDSGETVDLYVWPLDAGNLASGIEIVARAYALSISSGASGSVYRNLQIEMTADTATSATAAVRATSADNIDIQQCVFRHVSARDRGWGAVYTINCDALTFRHNEIRDVQNSFGAYVNGTEGGDYGTGAVIEHNLVERISQTGFRVYGQRNIAVRFNRFTHTGKGAHSNKINFYIGCDVILLQGNIWEDCEGYITLQDSSRLLVLNNIAPTSDDGRSFDDQTRDTAPPTDPSNNYLVGNLFPLSVGSTATHSAIDAQKQQTPPVAPDPNWGIYNNVSNGILCPPDQLIGREHNVLTEGEADGSGEIVAADVDIYYNAPAGNWLTVPGSPLLDMAGKDVTAIIEEWEGYFPALDLRRDVLGNVWNPAVSGVGPYARGSWPVQADTTPPILSDLSATISGATAACAVTTDEIGGTLYWLKIASGGAAPTAAYVKANAEGSQEVGMPAGEQSFSVSGTVGEAYDLYVTHEDRHGNLAVPVTTTLEFAAYSPLWVAFAGSDNGPWLQRVGAITGAKASTQSFLIAVTHKQPVGATSAVNAGILSLPSPSNRSIQIDYMGNYRLRAMLKEVGGSIGTIFDGYVGAQTGSGDVEFLTLYSGFNDGTDFRMQIRSIKIADGTPITKADAVTSKDNATSFAGFNRCDLLKAAGAYERVMLWDNASVDIVADAGRDLFYDRVEHKLKDPAVAVASLGTPLINLYGARLTSGDNAGSGGDWEYI